MAPLSEAWRAASTWHDRRLIIRGFFYRAWHRLDNRRQDLWAVLRGACNASTWDPATLSYNGGYSHWRCGKPRGHDREVKVFRDGDYVEGATYGPHRFINYTWEGPGHQVEYAPLPIRNRDNTGWFDIKTVIPFYKLARGRRGGESARRSRLLKRHYQEQMLRRRAEKRVDASARLAGAIEASFRRHRLSGETLPTGIVPGDKGSDDRQPEDPR